MIGKRHGGEQYAVGGRRSGAQLLLLLVQVLLVLLGCATSCGGLYFVLSARVYSRPTGKGEGREEGQARARAGRMQGRGSEGKSDQPT